MMSHNTICFAENSRDNRVKESCSKIKVGFHLTSHNVPTDKWQRQWVSLGLYALQLFVNQLTSLRIPGKMMRNANKNIMKSM